MKNAKRYILTYLPNFVLIFYRKNTKVKGCLFVYVMRRISQYAKPIKFEAYNSSREGL